LAFRLPEGGLSHEVGKRVKRGKGGLGEGNQVGRLILMYKKKLGLMGAYCPSKEEKKPPKGEEKARKKEEG